MGWSYDDPGMVGQRVSKAPGGYRRARRAAVVMDAKTQVWEELQEGIVKGKAALDPGCGQPGRRIAVSD